MFVLAAKRRQTKRRRFNLRQVRVATSPAIGALASEDVTAVALTDVTVDPLQAISFNATYSWVDLSAAGDGALEFGLAHGDYTAAEIEECLEAAGGINQSDKTEMERANRLVRRIGVISTAVAGAGEEKEWNNGRQVKTKLNWRLGTGIALNIWFRNGSGTVYVTGSSMAVLGTLWVKDL